MKIIEINPEDRRQIKQFLELPFQIYADNSQWVPPLDIEIRKVFNRRKFPFYQHGDASFLLALDASGVPVGRLTVIENQKYNKFNQERTAFFYHYESFPDAAITQALFEKAFDWAEQRGLTAIIGPKGFTALDGFGLLVQGFEHRPAFGQAYNPPYYLDRIENLGFECEREMLSGYLDGKMIFPEKIQRASKLIQIRRGLHVARFNSRRELLSFLPHLKELYNGSLAGGGGNPPITEAEAKALADQILWFANPRLIKVVMKDKQPVGFLFAYPDISAAAQRIRGKVFPLGWIRLFLELRHTKWININGAGMIEGYRGLGGTALLFNEMYNSVAEEGYRFADIVQIRTENENMLREMSDFGIDFYKRHRLYRRNI